MIALLKRLREAFRRPDVLAITRPPTTPPTGQCRACGQPFGGLMLGTARPVPSIRYEADPAGERLVRTCPTCGYRWNEQIKP